MRGKERKCMPLPRGEKGEPSYAVKGGGGGKKKKLIPGRNERGVGPAYKRRKKDLVRRNWGKGGPLFFLDQRRGKKFWSWEGNEGCGRTWG